MSMSNISVYGNTPQTPKSSAKEGLVTAAGTAALTAGSYALQKRLDNPARFAQLVQDSIPQKALSVDLNRFQKPLANAKYGVEHFGNFVKHAANTPAGKGALAFTAISALGLGALSAWQTDRHNQIEARTAQVFRNMNSRNSVDISPMLAQIDREATDF